MTRTDRVSKSSKLRGTDVWALLMPAFVNMILLCRGVTWWGAPRQWGRSGCTTQSQGQAPWRGRTQVILDIGQDYLGALPNELPSSITGDHGDLPANREVQLDVGRWGTRHPCIAAPAPHAPFCIGPEVEAGEPSASTATGAEKMSRGSTDPQLPLLRPRGTFRTIPFSSLWT
jgi:hypothetical protein